MMKDFVDHDFSTHVWDYNYKTNSKDLIQNIIR